MDQRIETLFSEISSLQNQISQMDAVGNMNTNLEIFNAMDRILDIQARILMLMAGGIV